MKRHIPAPFRGHAKLLSYCGEPYAGRASPYDLRNAVLLAAVGGLLRLYCPLCLAKALASAFQQVEYGARGARRAQERRSPEERQRIALVAAHARWRQRQAGINPLPAGQPEPVRLGMAPDAEELTVRGIEGVPAEAAGD